jgi:MOSC domain-containing protein YiiM
VRRYTKARFDDHAVNVGQPKGVVSTSIYKAPVAGSVGVGRLALQGDNQTDLTVPGGPKKAVYG